MCKWFSSVKQTWPPCTKSIPTRSSTPNNHRTHHKPRHRHRLTHCQDTCDALHGPKPSITSTAQCIKAYLYLHVLPNKAYPYLHVLPRSIAQCLSMACQRHCHSDVSIAGCQARKAESYPLMQCHVPSIQGERLNYTLPQFITNPNTNSRSNDDDDGMVSIWTDSKTTEENCGG